MNSSVWVKCKQKLYKRVEKMDDTIEFELYDENDNEQISNLSNLKFINIPTILNVLKLRYENNKIYTFNGNILISINPFKQIKNLYDIGSYTFNRTPHIYQIAEDAYQNIDKKNQALLVSGESGAGKTENTKHILKYLCSKYSNTDSIANKIITSNHIIEMLGNSKTCKNNNSSRFGKFIKLFFKDNLIVGANIESYLLEKTRVTRATIHEKCYHIFYLIGDPALGKYKFKKTYELLEITDKEIINEFNNATTFIENLKILNFDEIFIDKIFITIKIILELLDIKDFDNLEYSIYPLIDDLIKININSNDLILKLSKKILTVGRETIHKYLNSHQKYIRTKSFCEDLYETLFNEIIAKINENFGESTDKYIGILDIFGFEIFKNNGFEQLCINYTNEVLQNIYNNTILENEQSEYILDGIDWKFIHYNSNKNIIKFFRTDMFNIINEQSILESGNNENIFNQLSKLNNSIITTPPKYNHKRLFIINHYAGKVKYQVNDFILKNRIKSVNRHIKTNLHMFEFKLEELLDELKKTNCMFIRCIKPNDINKPMNYNLIKIHEQLLYSGIVEGIRLVQKGYPVKIFLEYLQNEFKFMTYHNIDIINLLVSNPLYNHKYCIGNSKLFLKKKTYNALCKIDLEEKTKTTIFIQKYIRKVLCRCSYAHIYDNIKKIQSIWRKYSSIKILKYKRSVRATNKIINRFIKYYYKKKFKTLRKHIILLQSIMRKRKTIKVVHTLKVKIFSSDLIDDIITNIINKTNSNTNIASIIIICACRRHLIHKKIRNRESILYLKNSLDIQSKVLEKEKERNNRLKSKMSNMLKTFSNIETNSSNLNLQEKQRKVIAKQQKEIVRLKSQSNKIPNTFTNYIQNLDTRDSELLDDFGKKLENLYTDIDKKNDQINSLLRNYEALQLKHNESKKCTIS